MNIVELLGTIGSAPEIDRTFGFKEILKDHPNYRIIVSESGEFVRSVGKEVMQKILKDLAVKGQKMDVLFAHNDDMAIGAIEAMEAWGIKPGKDVVIVSVDGIRDAFTAMIAGKLNCSVECSPLLGPQLMKAVKDYMSGKDLPVRIVTSEVRLPRRSGARNPADPQVLSRRRASTPGAFRTSLHSAPSPSWLCPKSAQNSRIV